MPAYIVSRVKILNPEAMQRYMKEPPVTVAAFGGRYLVRGNDFQALEGAWEHERMSSSSFPTTHTTTHSHRGHTFVLLFWERAPGLRRGERAGHHLGDGRNVQQLAMN
jgi:uncharacterized protein (DUF1330 family)